MATKRKPATKAKAKVETFASQFDEAENCGVEIRQSGKNLDEKIFDGAIIEASNCSFHKGRKGNISVCPVGIITAQNGDVVNIVAGNIASLPKYAKDGIINTNLPKLKEDEYRIYLSKQDAKVIAENDNIAAIVFNDSFLNIVSIDEVPEIDDDEDDEL